jgi:hypothetical protein
LTVITGDLYFALTPGEYIEQADLDEQAQPPVNWELTPEESEKQDLIDSSLPTSVTTTTTCC